MAIEAFFKCASLDNLLPVIVAWQRSQLAICLSLINAGRHHRKCPQYYQIKREVNYMLISSYSSKSGNLLTKVVMHHPHGNIQ